MKALYQVYAPFTFVGITAHEKKQILTSFVDSWINPDHVSVLLRMSEVEHVGNSV